MDAIESRFLTYLKNYITPHKLERIEEVLTARTRYFTVVLEDIYKPHNASAVLRTADCFGIQDVHVIEKANTYKINPYVTRGAAQWVDVHKYAELAGSPVSTCFDHLRSQGYQIIATSPRSESLSIQEFFPDRKTALVFGNEHEGVSEDVIKQADGLIHIPMYGFTESFNISVTASVFLYDFLAKLRGSWPEGFFLKESEKEALRYRWYQEIVKNAEIHRNAFFGSNQIP
ncbi:TrmH family RNA methyltransferase [Lunatimonas salinarum]|uniref:TrmH family RNA methyltransferase n=1 Tax=Lunatimonas salinarum TaxID=1774590 RepID=UPI001AE0834C|nr:RNA methyltransferase [Lunatimonas salinarum]